MAQLWKDDEELVKLIHGELFSAVAGDIMDKCGLLHQFLPPEIRPLHPDMVVAGRAMTVLEADCWNDAPGWAVESSRGSGAGSPLEKPFGLMLEALDDLKRGEVYVCTGGTPGYALWGELMSTRAIHLGAAGAVVDGYSRDTKGILALKFPTFSHGCYAQDQSARGKVIDFRIPIEMGGVRVSPGDMLVGDIDGVCVVPREAEEEVFSRAIEKARGEKLVKKAIEEGMGAREAFDKYGIM